jgi:hypothetical protein
MVSRALIELADETEIAQARRDATAQKQIEAALLKFYPGHVWAVKVYRGLAAIHNLNLSGEWGFRLDIPRHDWSASELQRAVMLAGGELLERYKLSRGKPKAHELEALRFDPKGNAIHA